MNARDWLDNLSERERRLVYAAAGLVGVALLYLIFVLPFQTAHHKLNARVEQKSADLAWLRQVAPQLANVSNPPRGVPQGESLVVLVDRTAREAGLGASLRDQSPTGNQGLKLRLEAASFDAMVAWLASLQQQYGVGIEAAMIDAAAPGLVNASLTLTHSTGG